MSNYRTAGTHQLNKWLWSKLATLMYKGEPAFGKYSAAGGNIALVPFVPSQQLPTFTNISGGAPFVVYNYSNAGSGEDFWMQEESVAYIIYDSDEERLRAIHTYMVDLLRRMDWTASEINNWIRSGTEAGTQADDFDFKSVMVVSANGPEPFEQQGGRQGAIVVARLLFTHELSAEMHGEGRGMRK